MILERLRRETADLHASLEEALPLGTAVLSRDKYATVLRGFYGFFATWEKQAWAAATASLRTMLAPRLRLQLLEADLVALGFTCVEDVLPPAALPDLASTASLLGSMYVLEGSRLGGQLIARHAERSFALDRTAGTAFFNGFGSETGAKWKEFRLVLESAADSVAAENAMIAAARHTFHAFHCWMLPFGKTLSTEQPCT